MSLDEYERALKKKGSRTWRSCLLSGIDVAHDMRRLRRPPFEPYPLDNIHQDPNPKQSVMDELDDIYRTLEERQKKARG